MKPNYLQDDTIAAVATPPGIGGIAVLRISGPEAVPIVDQLFRSHMPLHQAESRRAYLGHIVEPNGTTAVKNGNEQGKARFLDEVLVTTFRRPHSYTAEDVVEISCHGGRHLTGRVLELIVAQGARLAEPGEFTLRAFLNGRLDLSQAEAVADIIRARTDLNLRAAVSQFHGVLSERVRVMRQKLIETCSLLELELDFSEEDVLFADRKEVDACMGDLCTDISALLGTYRRGRILREGARLAIVGKPNVGKSTLLNSLLKDDRAIVTATPGTTRDTLEEYLDIRGVPFRVIDTAGIRETEDAVEKEGVSRSLQELKLADVILLMLDASNPIDDGDRFLLGQVESLRKRPSVAAEVLLVMNKIDLPRAASVRDLPECLIAEQILEISAQQQFGFDELEAALVTKALGREVWSAEDPHLTNVRQRDSLERALHSLEMARSSLGKGVSAEFVALDLRAALTSLGEIIGEVSSEDILGNIFSKFCIGK